MVSHIIKFKWTILLALAITVSVAYYIAKPLTVEHVEAVIIDICQPCYGPTKYVAHKIYKKLLDNEFLTIYFYVLIAGILLLELKFPANKNQRLISTGFMQDMLWLVLSTFIFSILFAAYYSFLHDVHANHLGFLTNDLLTSAPFPLQFILIFLLSDFLHWFHHYLRHKVPWFWYFHTVHHSQKEMNIFTDNRVHPVEYLVADTIRFIPFLSLAPQYAFPTAIGWKIFSYWYTRLYHANIRTNFGILRYVLVTPQSHRIHHSIEERHRDKNFGVIFSIWDFMFGTQYRKYDEYPETGIPDKEFPYVTSARPRDVAASLWGQLCYPFQLIGRSLRAL